MVALTSTPPHRGEVTKLQRLYGQRVAGILLRPGYGPESRGYVYRLVSKGIHILEYDYVPPGRPYPHINVDHVGATRQAVQYLHSLGHRDITALGTYHPQIHPEARSQAFPAIMAELGLTVRSEYQRVTLLTEDTVRSA